MTRRDPAVGAAYDGIVNLDGRSKREVTYRDPIAGAVYDGIVSLEGRSKRRLRIRPVRDSPVYEPSFINLLLLYRVS